MTGKTLGHYQVSEKLGAGGMGEVYRARDTRLNRDVALKFLPAAFANDRERLARFEREAQLLAQLNHPNIGGIHGLEESGGVPYLVLEYVPGETLKGPLPVDEALAVATQIADAMEEAHGKGIVHRDLKPANIKITPEGKVKVLDFGLAKAFGDDRAEGDPARSPTMSALATRMGTILGTAAYMSPEQARGRKLDKRTDVWSFGCVLYEMLTGSQAFGGDTVSDCIMAVLGREPDWSKLPAQTPANVQRLLRLCLEKDLGRRLRDIGDAWIASDQVVTGIPARPPDRPGGLSPLIPWAVAAIVAAAAIWTALRAPQPAPRQMIQFTAAVPQLARAGGRGIGTIALSPDGTRLAYAAGSPSRLHVRMMDQLEGKAIPGTDEAISPFFSPDGQWLGFFQQGKWKKVQVIGGATITLCDGSSGNGASWGHDGSIIFGTTSQGLSKVSAAGGTPQAITQLDAKRGDRAHRFPQILPGGEAVLYAAGAGSFDDAKIVALSFKTGQQRVLVDGGTYPRYAHTGPAAPGKRGTGHIVYWRSGSLFAVPFDLAPLEVTGSPVPILEGVGGFAPAGNAQHSFSDVGSLVFVQGVSAQGGDLSLAWVDRQGKAQPIPAPPHRYSDVRLSPEGHRVAVTIGPVGKRDVWAYDLPRGTLTRLTFQGNNASPVWTLDGKRVTFANVDAGKSSLAWVLADGSGPPETLAQVEGGGRPRSWSPDGKLLAFDAGAAGQSDIMLLPFSEPRPSGSGRTPQPFLKTPHDEQGAAFSPDGRWIAYDSGESGGFQVYVRPAAAGAGGKWQVSTSSGRYPRWARGGRELFYVATGRVMSVEIEPGPTFRAGTPKELFTYTFPGFPAYDVSADGKRFLMIKSGGTETGAATPELHFVLEWFEDIRRRVRTGG